MDDTEFLSELEHMEQHIDGESSAVPFHATFDRLDDGLGYGRGETDHGTRRHWRDDEASNTLDDADAPAAASDSRRNTLLAILGFALMMAIGAAAAAFLFRDRLALLLR